MLTIHDYETVSPRWFAMVIGGMRNSWESWEKGDSYIEDLDTFKLGAADKQLANKLISAGKDHGKFLRQLPILIDFTAPEYFLKEFDTYKVATVCNRTSMMHTLGKEEFKESYFSFEDTPKFARYTLLELLNRLRLNWLDAGKRKGPNANEWRAMVQAIPQSWNYRSTWSANYQTLRDMYFARRNHRLAEWRQFCSFIEQLPYSELITVE